MPSPVGHAIGGMAAGWGVAGRVANRGWIGQAVLLGMVGMLPDIDLLFGNHSGPTHSIGAVLMAGAVAWLVRRRYPPSAYALPVLAVIGAWSSHIVLDWAGEDTSAPFGVMALWPFSDRFFMSPVAIMPSITRRYWLPGFWEHNLRAMAFEIAVLGPVLLLVWWGRRARAADAASGVSSG